MLQSLFISHGSPDLVLRDHPARRFLLALGHRLPKPRGALIISAHFETPDLVLGSAERPDTLHDFYGFPDALYQQHYPAPGLATHAHQLASELVTRGYPVSTDSTRPLDHGIWSPLSLIWPEADVPLMPVSVPMTWQPQQQLAVSRHLGDFAEREDVWLIGSGAATHNLGDRHPEGVPPDGWAQAFNDWTKRIAQEGNLTALSEWQRQAPRALHAHPTPEHFLPLLMTLGAMQGKPMIALHDSFASGNLSMLTLASSSLCDAWYQTA
ncbi:DODA-type extradiol aromatic ring-opening family dioxygenase [Aidingimonas lacisalsi]|uniref:DODA-type extradiol aromatic ring-opening family dioxygenase n=1 Tax=Aidingimonas lacisalsi TaxID=2604086 RepID=UPI0011D28541|nr:class III extradiol ring-cleavage dioxygenase [Aidingimonas lacisalsi]